MHRMKQWALLTLVGALSLGVLQGCPDKPDPIPDGGSDVGQEDAGTDAGVVDAGFQCFTDQECQSVDPGTICWGANVGTDEAGECIPKCRMDDDCQQFNQGLRCDEKVGRCIDALGCNIDSNCNVGFDPDHYCSISGPGCRCVTETNDTGFPGVCRRVRNVCDECTDDSQCGQGAQFEPNGRCRPLQGDPHGALPDGGVRKYCFQTPQAGVCGCGMSVHSYGDIPLCVPQSQTCDSVGCAADRDCPNGSVCDVDACLCKPRCVWNFDPSIQALNPPGCKPNETCWVDPENLDADSPFFGAGRCEAPCQTDEECAALDPRLVCKGETVSGTESAKRCRPAGECMDDWECPDMPQGSVHLGYCDRNDFSCKQDCRTGTDPVTGRPYDDCINGYKCVSENGANVCKQQTCVELGGARIACNAGQFCCGEDKDGDGIADPCPSSGIESNQCYDAPEPPFCTTCQSHDDCNQHANPSGSQLPALCMQFELASGPANLCAPATYNDYTVDSFGVPKAFRGCPAKYAATPIKVSCTSNADCDPPGAPGTGTCAEDMSVTLMDGSHPLICMCKGTGDGTSISNCPNDPNGGTVSFCRYAPQGLDTFCVQSVVCLPSPGYDCGF